VKDLFVDPSRLHLPETGIYVRAQTLPDKWDSVDIAHLSAASLLDWLRSHGGDNHWAECTVLLLLGHKIDQPFQD
jgi:hypothetical protein